MDRKLRGPGTLQALGLVGVGGGGFSGVPTETYGGLTEVPCKVLFPRWGEIFRWGRERHSFAQSRRNDLLLSSFYLNVRRHLSVIYDTIIAFVGCTTTFKILLWLGRIVLGFINHNYVQCNVPKHYYL